MGCFEVRQSRVDREKEIHMHNTALGPSLARTCGNRLFDLCCL